MIPILLGALLVGAAAVVLTVFWKEIKSFLEKSWSKIKEIITPALIKGFQTFLTTGDYKQALSQGVAVAVQKFFSKTALGEWTETIINRTVNIDEIPSDLKSQLESAKGELVDISERAIKELELEV